MPEFRWDAPDGEFKVCYLGEQHEGSFVEAVLRDPARRVLSWTADIEPRGLARIEPVVPLRLVDFSQQGLYRLGATLEVLGTRDYRLSWAWSRALWRHAARLDGIIYPCRHDNGVNGIALYDRARGKIALQATVSLARDRAWIGALARRYLFGLVP